MKRRALLAACAAVLALSGCTYYVPPPGYYPATPANYDQVTLGMSKAQVEKILGPPTTMETKDMIIFKKTTYRYEDGKNFAMVTFKNDECDGKDTNLTSKP